MKQWINCLRLLHQSGRLRYNVFFRVQLKCVCLVVISSLATIIFPSIVSNIIDQGIGNRNFDYIFLFSFLLVLAGIVMIVSDYAYQMSFYKFSQRFVFELKELVFEKLLQTNISFWRKHSAGDIFKILENDISAIQNMFTSSISTIVSSSVMFVAVAGYLIYIHLTIGILLIITSLTIVFVQHEFGKRIEKIAYPLREDVGKFTAFTNQVLNNIISIEMVGDVDRISERYSNMNKGIVQTSIKQLKLITILRDFISSYRIWSMFIVMSIGAKAVIEGSMTMGILVSLTMYTQWLLGPLMSLGNAYSEFKTNSPLFKKILDILKNGDCVIKDGISPCQNLKGMIDFCNVDFGYEEKVDVLKRFNLKIEPGQIIGITGHNGCGKTTLFRLLLKMCGPTKGDIFIDNVSIKDYSMEYLTKQIGCLLQDEFLLSGPLRQVIDIEGKHSDQEIELMMRNFYLTVAEFPQGLDTIIGENTFNLSGGQVQKIALTRLFLQDKAVYLLDEPTAAIDLVAEDEICTALHQLLKDKTAVIISHRKKILSICNKTIYMTEGEKNENIEVE